MQMVLYSSDDLQFGFKAKSSCSHKWCGATLQELSHAALDRQRWAAIVTMANVPTGVEPTVVDDESVIRPL